MNKLPPQSFKNFSGGYTRENAIISEKITQLVNGSKNIDIIPLQEDGFGLEVIAGNTLHSSITGKSIYNLFTYDAGDSKYLLAYTGDTVQEYNEIAGTYTAIKSGLTLAATKAGYDNISIEQLDSSTVMAGFFTNGVDSPFIYIKGNTPEVQDVNAVGLNGHTIKGHICCTFDERMWLADGSILYASKQYDPFSFDTAQDSKYYRFDSTILAVKRAYGGLLVSTSNGFKFGKSNGDGTYTWESLANNSVINHNCLVNHGDNVLFYANDGLYPVDITQAGVTQVNDTLSIDVDKDLTNFDDSVTNNAQLLEVNINGRRETWLHFPEATQSTVYIFRWKKGKQGFAYWLPPRIQQPINCIALFKDKILSGTSDGKVLEELKGSSFNSAFYSSKIVLPKVNFGLSSGKQETTPILFVDGLKNNNFYYSAVINGDTASAESIYITVDNSESLIWGSGNWGDESWALPTIGKIRPSKKAKSKSNTSECSLQIIIETKEAGNDFGIHGLELTKIKKRFK